MLLKLVDMLPLLLKLLLDGLEPDVCERLSAKCGRYRLLLFLFLSDV